MRRGAKNHTGQLSFPGIGALPNKMMRPKGKRGGAHGRLVSSIVKWSELPSVARLVTLTRTPAGNFALRGKGFVRGAKKGTADITGLCSDGRFVAVEVKVGCDSLRDEQREYLQDVIRRGGWAFVARSLEGLGEAFHAAVDGRYVVAPEIFAV